MVPLGVNRAKGVRGSSSGNSSSSTDSSSRGAAALALKSVNNVRCTFTYHRRWRLQSLFVFSVVPDPLWSTAEAES